MTDPNKPSDPVVPERLVVSGTPTEPLAITEAVATGTDSAAGQVDVLIGIELIDDPDNQRILRAAAAFLASPDGRSLLEITDHVSNLVAVEASYGGDTPLLVERMCAQMNAFHRQHCMNGARAELGQPTPDLLTLLYWAREAASEGSMMPADAREEVAELRRQIDARNLSDPIYDQMLQLAAILEQARPHMTKGNSISVMGGTIPALRDGRELHFGTVLQHAASMAKDPGKTPESAGILAGLAAQISGLVSQIQAALRTRRGGE